MPTVQTSSWFNVEGTLNSSFSAAIAAFALPSWLPTRPTVVHDWNEIAANLPCYGTAHIPVSLTNAWQGMVVGGGKRGYAATAIYEVSAFVLRTDNPNWQAQLRTMKDYVLTWVGDAKQLIIQDYAANPSSPSATEYLLNFGDIAPAADEDDSANPGIRRLRILIDYSLVYRVA